ncbi:MAG: hypothetical protein V4568_19150 [Pseudomonadota bacterium]
MFASIPYGWTGIGVVTVTTLGLEILASLIVPDLPAFRSSVNDEHNSQVRAERQSRLLRELEQRGDKKALGIYEQMRARVGALYETAGRVDTDLSLHDVDKLADLTVDYLNLCVVNLSLKERKDQVSEEDIREQISALQAQLSGSTLAPDEERQVQSILAEYVEASNRSRRLAIRRNALEAALISMPDKIEEVYQLVMASPFSSEMGNKVEESLARLRIAEEVAAEFNESEFSNIDQSTASISARSATSLHSARQKARSIKT